MRILDHRQDAEDATQETFSRLYRYGGRIDPARPVLPYLKRIASNRCRTAIAKRRPTVTLLEPVEDRRVSVAEHLTGRDVTVKDVTVEAVSVEDATPGFLGNAFEEELRMAMANLPTRHREAFERFHLQQKSYRDIADEMDCAEATVRTWVRRARMQLMENLRRRGNLR